MTTRALIATRKGLFTVERKGNTFAPTAIAFAGDNCSMAMADPRDGSVYAALGHGHFGVKLHKSTDGGRSFTEIAVPTYPPKPEGVEDLDPVRKTPIEWSLELIWSLEPGGADHPKRLWAGTVPGGLFRSDDAGASWQLMTGLWNRPERQQWFGGGLDRPGIHSIVVDPRDGNHVTVGISCGGAWITRDGGETWQLGGRGMRAAFMPPDQATDPNIQDPHQIAACAAAPDVLWTQHHNGIFRSTDGAASWQEIENVSPSVFGFAVAAHPRDPNTAWFVPAVKDEHRIPADAQLVVTRTRDGGKTFETLRNGLPQSWAYDLVFRHALAVDDTGDSLLFGSTTGNLYGSVDGGATWHEVSHNLPPIYCVKFVPAAT
ncbi:MAG TPA: exo-alpha-sialidase [Polyangia bacterium]